MTNVIKIFLAMSLFMATSTPAADRDNAGDFSPYVDSEGNIALPSDFRSAWLHMGTWLVTSTLAANPASRDTGPGTGFHDVYSRPEALKFYKKYGRWPDGAVLVMEVRSMRWDDMPTGHVIGEGDLVRWLVMIKDSKNRFPANPHWGDGWGWALFELRDQKMNSSTDYRNDCRGCHEPAKTTDWVFVQGYPLLR